MSQTIDAKKLREFRLARGLTQGELAARAKCHHQVVNNIERGARGGDPSLRIFRALAKGLALDPLEVFDLVRYWPIPYKLQERFRTACKRGNITVLQAFIDFMEVFCAEDS